MIVIRARTVCTLTIAVAMALTACTPSDSDPVADDSPSPAVTASEEPADDPSEDIEVETVDGVEVNADTGLPTTNPQGMTVGDARDAGWDEFLHPSLPSSTVIEIDLRNFSIVNPNGVEKVLEPEDVPLLAEVKNKHLNVLNEDDVLSLWTFIVNCNPDNDYVITVNRDREVYECAYEGTDTVGDTGKRIVDVTFDDIFLGVSDDGTVTMDNIICDMTAGRSFSGCPDGDIDLRATSDELSITIRGFERDNGEIPTLAADGTSDGPSTGQKMACRGGDAGWFQSQQVCGLLTTATNSQGDLVGKAGPSAPFDVEWLDNQTVRLTYPATVTRRGPDKVAITVTFEDGTEFTFDGLPSFRQEDQSDFLPPLGTTWYLTGLARSLEATSG